MGAWGVGPFDDDDALDFLGELADADGAHQAELMEQALSLPEGYLDIDVGARVIVVAVVVAIARSPAVLDAVCEPHAVARDYLTAVELPVDGDTVRRVGAAVERAVAPNSEWHDLWLDAGRLADALAPLQAVRDELRAPD